MCGANLGQTMSNSGLSLANLIIEVSISERPLILNGLSCSRYAHKCATLAITVKVSCEPEPKARG